LKGEYRIPITADLNGVPNTGVLTMTVKGNKASNGSFEQSSGGSTPDSWTPSGSTSYEGQSASAGSGGSWTSAPVAVTPGASYDLAVTAAGSPGTVLVQQLSGVGALLGSVSLPAVGAVSSVLTVVPGATQVRIVLKGGLTGTTFDDVGLFDH
jgi:hypothetical protein